MQSKFILNYIVDKKMTLSHITLIAVILALVSSNIPPHIPPIISHVPKTYQINLDDSP